jgi:hypothetical protein
MSKYIKVTEKDKSPVVVLSANRAFFASRGFKIEEPTQKEIEAFFPEEKQTGESDENARLEKVNAELETVRKELEAEKSAHTETAKALGRVNAELETVKATVITVGLQRARTYVQRDTHILVVHPLLQRFFLMPVAQRFHLAGELLEAEHHRLVCTGFYAYYFHLSFFYQFITTGRQR